MWAICGVSALVLSLSYLVHAQLFDDAYTVRTIHIFPGGVAADGWKNAETITFQNLEEYALLQEFNAINSATMNLSNATQYRLSKEELPSQEAVVEPEAPVSTSTETVATTTPTDDLEVGTTTEPQTSTPVFAVPTTTGPLVESDSTVTSTTPAVTSTVPLAPEVLPSVADPTTTPSVTESTTTVLQRVESLFALAVSAVTSVFEGASSTDSAADPATTTPATDGSEAPPTTVQPDDTALSTADSSAVAPEPLPVTEELLLTETATTATGTTLLSTADDQQAVATNSPDLLEPPVVSEPVVPPLQSTTTAEVSSTTADAECIENCRAYAIVLSDFGYPLEPDAEVTGAQLRLSFAALRKETRDHTPLFDVRYSLDGGVTWQASGSIVIDGEASNSINGGYYLFALPEVNDETALAQLQVELGYHDDPEVLSELYVESAWLELFTLEPPEEVQSDFLTELLMKDGYVDTPLSGDYLTLPDGEELYFGFTDENDGESLIIKSNENTYNGLSEVATYFSVTNTTNDVDEFSVQAYFPDGVGEVANLELFNQNRPRDVVVPEYRPYVYHCEAGWEYEGEIETSSLDELSRQLSDDAQTEQPAAPPVTEVTESETDVTTATSAVQFSFPASSTATSAPLLEAEEGDNTTTTVLNTLPSVAQLLQLSTVDTLDSVNPLPSPLATSSASSTVSAGASYSCRNTNIVRQCDELAGGNTACRVNQVRVMDHNVVQYAPGWDKTVLSHTGALPEQTFLQKAASFVGLNPDRKEVPDRFEVRAYTEEKYAIQPGETLYFKMDISFPPFSSGEYWIEAIGDSEYGLLDPFWSSQWTHRIPITIDNTAGSKMLTEHQVFLELDSSLTDFWTNVSDDGGDIRFVQETVVGNEEDWYGTGWGSRMPITIQASQVDANLTDFPVYVDLADLGSAFFAAVQNDGDDIRITGSNGITEMPYELVSINTGAETGELHFKADSISSSTDTTFYIYHDNPNVNGYSATDAYGSENVWGSEFVSVYHMEEAAAGRGNVGLYQDSTSNAYDADDELNSSGKTGKLGQGQEVDAQGDANEYILLPSDIVNGENNLTFSMWMNSSDGANQALLNGGADNNYLFYLTGGGTNFDLFPGGAVTVSDLTVSAWRYVTVSRNAGSNLWEVFVDGQSAGTNSTSLSALSIPADCLVIGLEQDGSCLNSGDTSQHLNASIDEVRFRNDIPTDEEISATFRNQSTTTDFYAVGSVDTLAVTAFSELDHWVQYFSTTTEEADIWVQVDSIAASASTTIYLYYGSTGAVSASDEYAPFTYSTPRDLYYVVNPSQTNPIVVYSLIDGNEVSIDGGTPVTLDSGESTSFSTYASTSVISAHGPITSRTTDDASEPVVPIAFATTTHITTTNRNNEDFYVFAPFATTTVNVFEGANVTETASSTVGVGAADTYNVDLTNNTDFGIIESDEPILLYHNNDTDSYVAYPPTTRDLYGIYSTNYLYGSIAGGASVEVYCSNGNNGTTTGMTRGGEQTNDHCGGGANGGGGTGNAIRLTNASDPIGATQEADGDGNESTRFLPTPEFGTRYILPQAAEYVTVACAARFGAVNVEVQDTTGSTIDSGTCTPGTAHPGALNFTPGAAYTQGYQVVSTNQVPFYVYYEDNGTGDETHSWSAVQARSFGSLDSQPYTFGAQEINIDAEYEQYSYAWYQNINSETPTTTWSLGDDGNVSEGEAITGQGAVNGGDVLRLRMSLLANVATGTASSTAFALQYAAADTCETATNWYEIGKVGSTTAAFSGYNNASVDDGLTLTSTLLASSTVFGTYEEASLSEFIPNDIAPDEVAEWDWVLTSSNATVNTDYCFRMVRSSGDALMAYSSYPQLLTAGPPQAPTLLKRFDNEHAASLRPTLDFVASDSGGDDLQYQIQIDDDVNFGSTVFDQDSENDFLRFENVPVPSDKAPFTSGQIIRYTPPSDLMSSTTYWWRVRAIDPAGSNTYSDWSTPFSFTVNESLSVSEWFQTTDEQFVTNALTGVATSGSDSMRLDIGGSNSIGEYGSVDVTNGATTTVNLYNSYTNPVVTASVEYSKSVTNGDQPSARVFNKTGTAFDVISDNYTNNAPGTSTVHYVVMEAGEYLIDDGDEGLRVYATSTSVSGYIGSPITGDPGLDITFPTSFGGSPAVLTMVTTKNDPDWILSTVYDGNDVTNPPTASQMGVYLQDNLATDGHTSAEDVDIIAFDQGVGTNDGVPFDIFNTGITTTYVDDTPDTFTFTQTFTSVPGVTAVQELTMNGDQGGYAMVDIDTPVTTTGVDIAVEEGGTTGARTHADEDVAVVVFENATGTIIRAGNGQVTSSVIDFDDAEVGNAWGEVSFTDSGNVTYRVEYQTGSGFVEVPDSDLPGNSAGFTTSPINILSLDTDVYNELRLVAVLTGIDPEIFDWTVTWGQRVNIPELGDPFDNEKIATTTPTFDFTTTDPQGDALEYEISWSTDKTFAIASTTRNSSTSPDFSAGNPYTSGATVTFTVPPADAMTNNETYWWKVRAKDPNGGDSWSPWSNPDSFTIDTTTVVSTWLQTTSEQFEEGTLDGVTASTSDSMEITTEVGEYGTTTVTNNDWTTITTDLTYNNMVVVASPEYAFNGTDNGRTVQVRNKTSNSFEIKADNYTESLSGSTDVDYIVMEAGDWLISDGAAGTRVIAGTAEGVSTVKGSSPGYTGGTQVTFSPAFSSTPGALTTISSANGNKWVATVIDDGTQTGEITAASMYVSLGIGLDTDTVRDPEDIDYLAFEAATGTNNGVLFDAFNTPDVVTESETESTINFNQSFSAAPQVIVVQNNGTDGADGGFAQVDTDTAVTATQVDLTVAEMGASAGNHTPEIVSLLAFEGGSGTIRRESTTSGGLTGTVASEPILFSDGFGPKFERALFSTSSPGNSSTSVQVQYQTATGSWALIPDSQIANNSTGNTLSPIDLTGVDVSTYTVIRLYATLQCDSSNCPTLDDWSIEWSEGVPISGTIKEYDRVTDVTSGTVQVAVNGVPGNTGTIQGDGTWTINNVTALAGHTVTVWVDGAAEADEAVSVFTYDGVGDMTGIELYEQHLTISADENGTTTNAALADYDNSVSSDEDIFFDVDGSNDLTVCAVGACTYANLYIGPGDIYIPDTSNSGNVTTHDIVNDGTFELDGNTMRISGSWDNNATVDMTGSAVIFTATSTSETIDDNDNLLDFNDVTFGETSGSANWKTYDPLDVNGDLTVDYGTFDRSSSTITVAGDVTTGVDGFWIGLATTTFDGTAVAYWSDANAVLQNVGYVVVDGGTKSVFLTSDVLSSNVTIEVNDTLNAGGANTLYLVGDFVNAGTFVPQTGTIAIVGTSTNATINVGGSELYNLTASSSGGSMSFPTSKVTILGDLTIATGTVTLATATTTINGSLLNTGGFFAHNNAEVRFTSAGSETVQLQGTEFFNHFYDVTFAGAGEWTFLDSSATTSNTFKISNGNVVMPSGYLSVARDFDASGGGSFSHNGGEVVLLIEGNDTVKTNGSAFNDVRVRKGVGSTADWYQDEWLYRLPVTVRASAIDADLTSFPVYVDLADLDSSVFSNINSDGGDIRVTQSDGTTEVAREVVNASTTAQNGELYFLANSLSSTTDTVFYLYYGNATATDYVATDTFGAEAVWSNGYVLVAHMNDLTSATILNSADGTLNGTKLSANNPAETSAGKIYEAQQDDSSDHIAFGNLGGGATNITIAAWFNSNDLDPGSGDNDTYGQTIFSAHSGGNYTWLTAGGTGNGGSPDEVRFCAFDSSAVCDVASGSNLQDNTWHYVSAAAVDGGAATIRVDGSQVASFTSDGGGTWNSGSTIGDLRPNRNIEFNGELDEIRVSDVVRSNEWRDASYVNQATTTDFYAAGSPQQENVRTFADTNANVGGDVVIESGTAVFPVGTLYVGGSFDNNEEFDANGGTVFFNSGAGAETIAAGNSSFYNLTFDSSNGDWFIQEHATATNHILLSDANSLSFNLDVVLESMGTFFNEMDNADTNWSGATLRLSSGNDFAINDKTHLGETYNILDITGDGDINMWNSSAATYNTQDTSSVYSQDHDGIDGDLHIFGDYVRESGTEYWSYATDFDGIDLVASGTERQVNVRVANGASVAASSSNLQIVGDSTASTTVDAQSGTFSLVAQTATVTASYFEIAGTDADGFQLTASTTVALLANAKFAIGASDAVTVDASTVDTNPAAQFFNTNFVTAGGNVNVDLSGSPTSFWWFREGLGDRYGEAFDNNDGNPGQIRWDDSNYQLTATGTVYADAGLTPLGGPTCDGVTQNVRVVVDGGAYTDATSCDGGTGEFVFTNISYQGDPTLVFYLDTNGGEQGSTITRTPTANIDGLDIYTNRIITRHEDSAPMTTARLAVYDEDDDSDLRFNAATGTTDTLTVRPDTELYVFATTTFTPGGPVTLESGGTGNGYDGSLRLDNAAIFTGIGTTTYTVGGSIILGSGASLLTASSTFGMTATTSGKSITAADPIEFNELQFTGVGGEWSINTNLTIAADITVATGTVVGAGDILVTTGEFTGEGSVDMTGGTVTINRSNTLGGSGEWTFNNLVLGDGINSEVTTRAANATTTVRNQLTIATGHFLYAYGSTWDLQGSGSVFVENGTFLEGTSTVRYSGATPDVLRTTYNNLVIDTNFGGTVDATAPVTGLQVLGDFTLGAFGTSTLDVNTNDPLFAIGGDVYIGALGTLEASDSAMLDVFGDWDNDGVFTANGGTVEFLKSGGAASVAAGLSTFATVLVEGESDYTFTESATATADFTIDSDVTHFTLSNGETLSVGGEFTNQLDDINTTWTNTTLYLYSGTAYNINPKSTAEIYNTITTADGTHVRLWNSTTTVVTTNASSSVYSMDHQGVDGDLYIFGDFVNTTYDDHWSYENDFDGTALGLSPRAANVQVENGGSVRYQGGSLTIAGSSTASTSVAAQGVGTFKFLVGGTTDVLMNYYTVRDTTSDGLIFTGTPNVSDISYGDFEVAIAGGSAMTVGGPAISANPAQTYDSVRLATTTAINAYNVTATGTSASAWRFVNVPGNLGGEAKDVDPGGDPGYITWEDSAAIINISGNVYSDEGVSTSAACDSTTYNIFLSVNGTTFASTTCNGNGAGGGTGAYTFTGISYGLGDTLTVYIDDEPENATTLTQDPISSISNFDLYENRVIIKHESGAPMTISDMGVWDSDDDADVLFDVETAGGDSLTLPADTKLIVWNNKQFDPNGDVTVSGGGAGAAYDGTVELQAGATWSGGDDEVYSIGGSLLAGAGAVFTPAQSTTTFTTTGAARTIDTNEGGFHNLEFTGSGSWTVSDTTLTVGNDYVQSAGAVTLPAATTTIGGSFTNSGGSFTANNGLLYLTATDAGNEVTFGGSDAHTVAFAGVGGSWTISDVDATSTDSFTVAAGSVTLPTGVLTVGDDFVVEDTISHSGGAVRLIGTGGGNIVTLSGNDLTDLTVTAGAGDYALTDASAALLGDLLITSGTFTASSGVLSIGGSYDATGGTFTHSNGTVLFNSADTGEFVDPGANDFYNVQFSGAGGGWTILDHATTTNNFTLSLANSFTQSTSTTLYVGGVFTNTVGGSATEWIGSTLVLDSGTEYETNLKTTPTEQYNILQLGANTDISSWNSAATSTSIPASSSWYSQDHAGVNGDLNIYGDYHIATTTEYWSRSIDFDGAALGGSPRPVSVKIASSSTITVDGGVLNMIGSAAGTTTVDNQGVGRYTFIVDSGTFNAEQYSFRNLDSAGLQLSGNATISSLDNGDFEQAANSTTLITLASTTLNANASLVIEDTRFANGGFTSGTNVSLDATTTNSWSFTGAIGNLWGEDYDIDGTDACSSIRWDDSQCLLTEQAHYRWRNDDGEEGAIASTWYDSNWSARKRVRVINDDAQAYADTAIKLDVTYDADMQTDFEDLRFTDATGTTSLDYWIERFTTGSEADVWVRVPNLATSSVTEIYMYYGNVAATSSADASNVFTIYDDFDDNNITEYTGDTSLFATAGTYAYGGGYGLDASPNQNAKATDGIARTGLTVSQGDIIRYMQYVDTTAGSADEACTMFGVQSPVTNNQNYGVCLEQFGTDRVSLMKDVVNTDSTGTKLGTTTITYATGWYEIEVDWQTDNTIDVSVFNSAGTLVATTSATDSTYTSGGIGFTFWGQHGGWDSYVAWPRTESKPTTYFGVEQTEGGATWAAAQDTPTGGFAFDETARLRIGIENTGLPIENQNFRLEFAPKLTAPSCEAVAGASFSAVPVAASCGTSAVCMTTSASTTDGDATTDHLVTDAGPFVAGEVVANASNETSNLDVGQNRYTELEYAIKLTTNAVNDAYCFRVTDGGSALDSYALLPELTLAFDPQIDIVYLNNSEHISLTPGTTTTILATTTVTDFNGVADLNTATTTFYKSTVGASCTPDNNNCYIASSTDCSFSNCSGTSCTLTCEAPFQFHADPTDDDGGVFWYAFMEVSDMSGAVDFGTSIGVDVFTMRALEVVNSINYGTVDVTQNTGTFNPNVSLENQGNESIDVEVAGTDMTDGITSVIPAAQQRFATTTFDYAACVSCNTLSVTGDVVEVDLNKPTTNAPPVSDDIYWGVEVPFGTASNPHSGLNTFTAVAD